MQQRVRARVDLQRKRVGTLHIWIVECNGLLEFAPCGRVFALPKHDAAKHPMSEHSGARIARLLTRGTHFVALLSR